MSAKPMDAEEPLSVWIDRKISSMAFWSAPFSSTRRFFTRFSWFSRDSATNNDRYCSNSDMCILHHLCHKPFHRVRDPCEREHRIYGIFLDGGSCHAIDKAVFLIADNACSACQFYCRCPGTGIVSHP